MSDKIMAYRRENGRVGVRNHVIILPVDDISNAACESAWTAPVIPLKPNIAASAQRKSTSRRADMAASSRLSTRY